MNATTSPYDPRYLAGILYFNDRDFFEAHEVWEDLWSECRGPEQKFYQGLIQAAVGLYHFGRGNLRGASKLYRTSRAYMERYDSPYLGLDRVAFWAEMERCFAPVLACPDPDKDLRPDESLIPTIVLNPPPEEWPDRDAFAPDDD